MTFDNYEEYVKATTEYYTKKGFKNPSLMVLPEKDFEKFKGVIEFGAGSEELTNDYGCNCKNKCSKCGE